MEEYIRLEFINLCRLCISYSHSSEDILDISSGSSNLTSKIFNCLSIKVEEDDPLPKKICKACLEKLESYSQFKLACSNSDATLQCYYSLFKTNIDNDGAIFIKSSEVGLPLQMFQDDINTPLTSDTCEILHANQQYIKSFREPSSTVQHDSNLVSTAASNVLVHQNFPTSNGQICVVGSTLQSLNSSDKATPMGFNDSREISPAVSGSINDLPSTFPLNIDNENIIVVDINKCNLLDFIDPGASIYVVNTEAKSEETNLEQLLQINSGPAATPKISRSFGTTDILANDTVESTFNQDGIDNINTFLNTVYPGQNPGLNPFQEILNKSKNQSDSTETEHSEIVEVEDESQNFSLTGVFDEDSIDKLIKRGPTSFSNKEGGISDKQQYSVESNKKRVDRTLGEPLPIKFSKPSVPVNSPNEKKAVVDDSAFSVIPVVIKQLDETLKSQNKLCRKDCKYECPKCNKWFKNVERYEKHLAMHSSNRSYNCQTCQITFQKKKDATAHFKIHQVLKGDKKVFKCPNCSKSFGRHWHLNRHAAHHRKAVKKQLICHVCSRKFSSKENLRQHILFHNKVYLCETCGAKYKDVNSFHKHKPTCSILKYTCKVCGADFDFKTFYLQHVNSNCGRDVITNPKVQEKRQISCHLCSKTFNEQYRYNMHIQQHKRVVDITKDNHYSGIISVKTTSAMKSPLAKPVNDVFDETNTNSSSLKISNIRVTSGTDVISNPSQDTNIADPTPCSNLVELEEIDKSDVNKSSPNSKEALIQFSSNAEESVEKSWINLNETVVKPASDSEEPHQLSSRLIKPPVEPTSTKIEPQVKLTLNPNKTVTLVEPTLISDQVVSQRESDTYNSNKLVSELTPLSKKFGVKSTINCNEAVLKPSLYSGKQVSNSSLVKSVVKHTSNLNESLMELTSNYGGGAKSSSSLAEYVPTLNSNEPVIKPPTSNFNILVEPASKCTKPHVELTSNSNPSFLEPPSNPSKLVAELTSISNPLLVEPKPNYNGPDTESPSKSNVRVAESTPCSNDPVVELSIISNKTLKSSLNSQEDVAAVSKSLSNSDSSDTASCGTVDKTTSPDRSLDDLIKDMSKNPASRKGLLNYLNRYFTPSDKSRVSMAEINRQKNIVLPVTAMTDPALPSKTVEILIERSKNKISSSQVKNLKRKYEKVRIDKDLACNSKQNQNRSVKSMSNADKFIRSVPSSSIVGSDNSQVEDLFTNIALSPSHRSVALMKQSKRSTEIHSDLTLLSNVPGSQMLESSVTSGKQVNCEVDKFSNILQRFSVDNISDKNTSNVAFDKSSTVAKTESNLEKVESQKTCSVLLKDLCKNENVSNRESEVLMQTTDLAISINDNLPDTLLTLQPTFERNFKSSSEKSFHFVEGHGSNFVDSSLEHFINSEPNFESELDNLIKEAVQTLDVHPPESYSVLPVSHCVSQAELKKSHFISEKNESPTSELLIESKETEREAHSNDVNVKPSFDETTVSSKLTVEVTPLPLKLRTVSESREGFSKEISSTKASVDKVMLDLDEDNRISQRNLSSAQIKKDFSMKNSVTDVYIEPSNMCSVENLKDKNTSNVITKGDLIRSLQTPLIQNIDKESSGIESHVDSPKHVMKPFSLNVKALIKNKNVSDNLILRENESVSLQTASGSQDEMTLVPVSIPGVAETGNVPLDSKNSSDISVLQSTTLKPKNKPRDKLCSDVSEKQSLIVNCEESSDASTKYLNRIFKGNSDYGTSVPKVLDLNTGCPNESLLKPNCSAEDNNFSRFSTVCSKIDVGEAAISLTSPVNKDTGDSKNKIISVLKPIQASEHFLKFNEPCLDVTETPCILENQNCNSKCKKQRTVIRNLEVDKLPVERNCEYSGSNSKTSKQTSALSPNKNVGRPVYGLEKNECSQLDIDVETPIGKTTAINESTDDSSNIFIPVVQSTADISQNVNISNESSLDVTENRSIDDTFQNQEHTTKPKVQTEMTRPCQLSAAPKTAEVQCNVAASTNKTTLMEKDVNDFNKTNFVLRSTQMSDNVQNCNKSRKPVLDDKIENQATKYVHPTVIRSSFVKKTVPEKKHNYRKCKNVVQPDDAAAKNRTSTTISILNKAEVLTRGIPHVSKDQSDSNNRIISVFQSTSENSLSRDKSCLVIDDGYENQDSSSIPIHRTVIRSPLINKSVFNRKHTYSEGNSPGRSDLSEENNKFSKLLTTYNLAEEAKSKTAAAVDRQVGGTEPGTFKSNKNKKKTKNTHNKTSGLDRVSPSVGFVILSDMKNQLCGRKRSSCESIWQISLPSAKDDSNDKEKTNSNAKSLKLSKDCNDRSKLKNYNILIEPCNSLLATDNPLTVATNSKATLNHSDGKDISLKQSEKGSKLSKASSNDSEATESSFATKNTIEDEALTVTGEKSAKQPIRTIRILLERFDPRKAHSSNEDQLQLKTQNPFKSQPYDLRKTKKVQTYICTKKTS